MRYVYCLLGCCVCLCENACKDGVCNVYMCWWLNVRENSVSGVATCVQFAYL